MGPQPDGQTTDLLTGQPDAASMPWPGEELVARVTGDVDRFNFYRSGKESVGDIEAVLAVIGRTLDSFPTILDFGSGCGRMMLWLEHLASRCSLHGVDIDARAVAWTQENIPWATFKVNDPLPPLDYPDGFFDLVFNHSVFTHIDEHYQDRWLAELRRVVKPGGYAILSVHGEAAFRMFEEAVHGIGGDSGVVRQELATKGVCYIKDDAFTGGPFPDFYHSTFHAPWYVFEHWGRYFDVAAYVPKGSMGYQDFVLLERRADDATAGGTGGPITRARPTASAAPAAPSSETLPIEERPLYRAGELLHRGVEHPTGGRRAQAVRRVRLLAERVLRPHLQHQRQVDEAIFTALWELYETVTARTTSGGVPLTELNARLWDAVRLQGQRINRLENDVWEELRSRRGDADAT
ncbi:MAG TPA: class I SAM-dependent methyltransferase [Acidimicrobiales bacterium]|nr:class I SAM-dependent methyltransferase [Acidimicrobiales bacterium]